MSLRVTKDGNPVKIAFKAPKENKPLANCFELFLGAEFCSGVVDGIELVKVAFEGQKVDFDLIKNPALLPPQTVLSKVPGDYVVFNGGYFGHDKLPEGLLVYQGQRLSAVVPKFSGLFIVKDGRGQIGWFKDLGEQASKADLAVQSGPFIVDPGRRPGIKNETSNIRFLRTVLAMENDGKISVLLFQTPLTLLQAQNIILKKFPKIDAALNLDGGPSSALIAKSNNYQFSNYPAYSLPYFIVIKPKKR